MYGTPTYPTGISPHLESTSLSLVMVKPDLALLLPVSLHREVKFFSFLQKCTMRGEKRLCEAQRSSPDDDQGHSQTGAPPQDSQGEDFYALIEKGRDRETDTTGIWQGIN